jgi:microcystin-dependent protein
MGTPYLAEIRIMSFGFVPQGWAACDGQLLPINQNQALYSLLGTTYGGNGMTNFALPNLQGKVPMHEQFQAFNLGQTGGSESVTLSVAQLPTHTHSVTSTQTADANSSNIPDNTKVLGNANLNAYSSLGPLTALASDTLASVGSSQPHNNMSPYLVLNFCIALTGYFPSHS